MGATGATSGFGCDRRVLFKAGGSFQPGGGVGFFWMLAIGGGGIPVVGGAETSSGATPGMYGFAPGCTKGAGVNGLKLVVCCVGCDGL